MQTAQELAIAIQQKQVSALDTVEGFLERILHYNGQLNAVVTIDTEYARRRAHEADLALARGETWGPLHGVPMTIKDSFDTGGMRTTAGYKPFSKRVPSEDALLVSRLRNAGAIIIGKTNLPSLASGIQSNNAVFGRTNNPWNRSYTPGGSSGGSAAAVAAGLTSLELGSDIGGSIRIPAHFCGIYGLKMTGQARFGKGHISSSRPLKLPAQYRELLDMASFGPLARSMEDLHLAFNILADWASDRAPDPPLKPLRIAYSDSFDDSPITSEMRTAISNVAEQLRCAGHQVDCTSPHNLDFEDAWELGGECLGIINTLFQGSLVRLLRRSLSKFASRQRNLHPIMSGLYRGVNVENEQVEEVLSRREKLVDCIESLYQTYDAWICPTFPTPAFTHRSNRASIDVDEQLVPQLIANLVYSLIFNVSGHPVIVIPVGLAKSGLPIGIQIVGKRFGENSLLEVSRRIDAILHAYCPPPEYGDSEHAG